MCENTSFEKCMKCGRYSVNECHGHKDKPTEEVIICALGGTKRWEYVNQEYQYKKPTQTNADKIRALSDEELAKFLVTFQNTFGPEYEGEMSCLDWLRDTE